MKHLSFLIFVMLQCLMNTAQADYTVNLTCTGKEKSTLQCSGEATFSEASSSSSSSSSSSGKLYDHIVSTGAELKAALAVAKSGDEVLLKDGNYGDLTITKQWDDYINLYSANPRKAVFGKILADGNTKGYLSFNGITLDSVELLKGAHHFKIQKSLIRGNIYAKEADYLTVENSVIQSDLAGSLHSVRLNSVSNVIFRHNTISNAIEDLMAITGDSPFVSIENNLFLNTMPKQTIGKGGIAGADGKLLVDKNGKIRECEYNHSDAIQTFGVDGKNPSNLKITGNIFYDDPADNAVRVDCGNSVTNMQGTFISDPDGVGYMNVLIADNLFFLGSSNSIYINGANKNVVVENNTLLGWTDGGGGTIQATERTSAKNVDLIIRNNLARSFGARETIYKIIPGQNFIYGGTASDLIFSKTGKPSGWEYYIPKDAKFSELGASKYLFDIQTGKRLPPGPINF